MSVFSILYAYEGLDDRMARYYRLIADTFRDDEEAARLFTSLGNDESQHMLIVADTLADYKKSPGSFQPIDVDIDTLSRILDRVDAEIYSDRTETMEDAMKFAMDMEVNCAELSNAIDLAYANPSSGRFHRIVLEDQAHLIKLLDFAESRRMAARPG
ncbi:MAG: hypothetical protein HZC51_00775 [Nitrospirae bacterium]|nr:hypothetical protein [Nitrospirota bacterium]